MHSWDGCEGINDTTYYFEGWQYLKPMREYYESVPFWTLQPNYTVCSVRDNDLVFSTMSAPGQKDLSDVLLHKKNGGVD